MNNADNPRNELGYLGLFSRGITKKGSDKMKHVFISYSSMDSDWARELCSLFEQEQAACFISERDLDRKRASWPTELMHALTKSDCVVLLLTRNSVASNEVLNEVANASALGKDVIPVLKEDIPIREDLMYFIRKYEWVPLFRFSDESGKRILLERVLGSAATSVRNSAVRIEARDLTQYEAPCFKDRNTGGYGAGYDKCLMQNGATGWDPCDIVLEEVLDEEFSFASIGEPDLDDEYREYCRTVEVQRMQLRGNDRTRWMIAALYQNSRVFLTLQKTRYSMTSFWWNRVRDNPSLQAEMAQRVFEQDDRFYPNSFCLHLILETHDGKLIGTRVSNNKKNDYAGRIAVTVGEQLSEIDFASRRSDNRDFVYQWVKRALIEEFGLYTEDYEKYVDVSSVRVLALSYEGDIYNFALPVFVRLKIDYDSFLTYLNATNRNNTEYTDIVPYTAQEALEIAKAWPDPARRSEYHPSSHLRALLYAVYKGADKCV